jgi:hypothetical protein
MERGQEEVERARRKACKSGNLGCLSRRKKKKRAYINHQHLLLLLDTSPLPSRSDEANEKISQKISQNLRKIVPREEFEKRF